MPADDDALIRSLLGRAVLFADEGSPDDYALIYAPDATWSAGDTKQVGIEEIVAATRGRRQDGRTGAGSNNRHVALPLQVEVDGDDAQAVSYFMLLGDTNASPSIKRFAVYADRLRRTPDGWRISARVIRGD